MNLPPLPLIDGHLFIDNSFLEKLNQCPRSCEYAYLHKRIGAWANSALNFGGAIHHALAHRYTHSPDLMMSADEEEQMRLLEEWFLEKPNPENDHRTLDLAQALIRGYNSKYQGEEFNTLELDGKPAVELPFAFTLYNRSIKFNGENNYPITIMYSGRIDLPVRANGQLFVVDHKTTSMLGDTFFKGLSVSPQMIGYCAGIEKTLGQKCDGFIVNALRVPKPTKRDGMVIRDDDFQRLKVYLYDGQVEEWRTNLIDQIEEFLWHHERGYMPQKKTWCVNKFGTCEYFDVCQVPPENRELTLQTALYTDNVWSPLNDFTSVNQNQTNQTK